MSGALQLPGWGARPPHSAAGAPSGTPAPPRGPDLQPSVSLDGSSGVLELRLLVSWVMKLNPQQAPLYGDCVVTVLLAEEDKVEDDVVFYLVFSGSTLHHCTSTRKVSSDTLETIAPSHDCCETVQVLLCASKEGLPVSVVADADFSFVQDEACDAAQFLATSAGNQQALNFTRFLSRSGTPSADVDSLDEKVALAFRHLKLPAEWNVLGTDQTLHDGGPRETLMHFAVRLGLLRLTWFLLQKPGGRGALCIHNQEGATPVSLALERGYHKLHQLLTEENAGEPDSWSSLSYEIPYGDCSVRHHRELDVYTLTSESQSPQEPLFPGDNCTGHIFKLMNIQQQLMKTNLKQMDSLMPLMMTAQDSSGSTAQDTDGQFLSRASVSTDSRQLSPPADAESSPCCPESTVGQIESSCDLSSVGKEEHKDRSYRKKSKDVGKNGDEVGPAPAVDSGTASEPSSCLQSVPDYEAKGTEGSPSCGIRSEETGTESAMATDQAFLSSGDVVRPGVVVAAPDTGQHFSAGELVVSAAADASVPHTAGETGHGLVNPDATSQKNKGMEKKGKQAEEHGESAKGRLENSDLSAAGASGVRDTSTPVDKAGVPNCVSPTSSVCGDKPAQSPLGFLSTEASIGKTADTGTSESCKESSAVSVDQNSLVLPAAAEDKISVASEPDAPLANTCEAVSPSDLNFPRPQKDVMPKQKLETNSSHVQSKSPICSTSGDDKLCAASTCQQSTVTSSGALAGKQHGDTVSQPGSTTTELPNTQHPPAAICPEGSATFDHVRDTRGDVGFCSLEVSDKEGQGRDLKLETSLTNVLEVLPHPHAVVPKAKKEPVSDQALSSGRTFSLASSPGNESVTKDDVLSLVPSQKEKGTATSEPYNAADCEDGRDSCEPDKQPLEDSAAGLPTPPAALPPSMGNASPVGFGGEQERPCPSAAPEVLSIEGDADCSLLRVGQAALASATNLTERGKNPVVPESSAAQGQDKDKAVIFSSVKEDTLSSGTPQEEQRTASSGQEAPGVCAEPSTNVCAEDKAFEGGSSWGTPLACLNAETKHNKEVAPPVSLLTEGGAARSLVPPGASLAADSSQEALCAEQSSSTPLQGLLPQVSEACNCDGSFALDVGVKETESLGASTAGEVRGNAAADAALASALQGTVGAGREAVSRDAHGLSTPEVVLNQGKNVILGLPEALPNKCATDLQGAASPEMVPLRRGKARLDGGDRSSSLGDSEDAQVGDDARLVPLQPAAETGVLTSEDKATGRERGAPPLPCAVSADAGQLPETAGSIEEAASRIVDAVIERVKASGALLPEGETSHMSPSCPESGPVTEQLESASAGKVMAFLPGETQQMGSVHEEAPGNPAGCFAGREESEKILRPVQGSELTTEMPDTKADDEVDFLSNIRESSVSEEVAAGDTVTTPKMTRQGPKTQAINRESWCTVEPGPDAASLLAPTQSPECENFLDVGLGRECIVKQDALKRESGSDSDLFHSPSEDVDSIIFSKPEEEQSVCDTTGSSSSTDDTASLDRHSSHGSDVSLPQISNLNRSRDQQCLDGFYSPGMGAEGRETESEPAGPGEAEEEEMDSITDVPTSCSVLRGSMRSLSPFRRHSWGPGKNAASDGEMNQRSSMRVLGDVVRRPPIHRRSMSWCPSGVQYSAALSADFNYRSFSLEGLTGGADVGNKPSSSLDGNSVNNKELRHPFSGEERGDSLVSLSEEDLEADQREHRMFAQQTCHRSKQQGFNYCTSAISSPLTKSISLMTISHPGLDSSRPFHSTSANLTESITEENYNFLPQSPSKKDFEGKSGTKVSRTFSYIKNKMSSSKKSKEKEKEKEKIKEKEKESKEKEKDKKVLNGHSFSAIPMVGPISCSQCMKPFTSKEAYTCANCSAFVHKGCRESLASCAKVKMKQPKGSLQAHDTSSLPTVIMRNKSASQPKERPRSAVLLADETVTAPIFANRRSQHSVSLSKSVSIQNIAGVGNDENISNTWKFLSHSTDSLNKIVKVNESTESLTDEGTDMNEGQLLGDFELESKQLEAESWSRIVDAKFLKQQKKDVVKRQEVIYELMQTELHHIRTLKIMSDVYSRGMMTDLLFEQQMVEKLFPCLDELISIHSQFLQRILERKKESMVDKSEKNFLIKRMGDVLVNQFSGENAERLKKTYGKFCGQHTQSVNCFKDLYTKDKRFQAFVKKKMSSSVVRRLGVPECILLVTQRITKYPVLFQRILQCTKDNEVEQEDLAQSLSLVKEVIGAVDSKVASYEKKVRLNEIYTRTDSKSIMRMKSGQMFAKEDLKRKKLVRDGSVFLKNTAGRLKEVQAVLLTDILVFLQEKDQKYIFASLDQKSTVISLKKLIVREVAHEEKGLFLISMGMRDPEMVEVHASSKEERNSWIRIIQDTINALNRDEDEGIPSENEEEKKMLDTKARELKEQLQQKDQQILLLLEEKEMIFRDMTECSTPLPEDCSPTHSSRILFRSNTEEALKGGPLMKSAINEVEVLQSLVSGSLGGPLGPPAESEGVAGPVSLPRRAETFGGFDSHQMNASKGGDKEEGDDGQDLRRTESDSGLKKGGNANLAFMLKRNNEQVAQSIVHLHELLSALQGVVSQQDSYIEDQKLMLSERALTRSSSRPSSLIEQEKQRSLEKQRQDLANLQKQQAQLLEEKRKREREWESRERALQEREARLAQREEDVLRGQRDLERDQEELQQRKGAYQLDLERLRAAQKQLEREAERLSQRQRDPGACQVSHQHTKLLRIPSFLPNLEESPLPCAPPVAKSGSLDSELSVSPKRNSISRTYKDKGPFHILSSTSQTSKAPEGPSQTPATTLTSSSTRLFGLAKPKDKKEKKKKNKAGRAQPDDGPAAAVPAEGEEIFC
ncbi:A-kinase anchor protein 13 isoform X4 [Pteropus medius]|uniref:A-kinase anchor protein 13 isoform X4 n=1 Tax=Pteropus vampyrus TaxID=132908 RepID=UPI00196AB536|nr:A-kinase anchor protein 13 isoform X4 [Pteropus giganteus]